MTNLDARSDAYRGFAVREMIADGPGLRSIVIRGFEGTPARLRDAAKRYGVAPGGERFVVGLASLFGETPDPTRRILRWRFD